jgi:leucyl aminopeptidase
MEFTLKIGLPEKLRTASLLVPVYDSGEFGTAGKRLDKALKGSLSAITQGGDIEGKPGECMVFPSVAGLSTKRLVLAGCGPAADLTDTGFRKVLQKACQVLRTTKATDVAILIEDFKVRDRDTDWLIQQTCEVFASGTYTFNQLKSPEKQTRVHLQKCHIIVTDKAKAAQADKAVRLGQALADAMDLARTLGNLPGNLCPPSHLAAEARKLARRLPDIKVKVLEEKDMRALGMGSFLSVTAGSSQPAKMVIMEYLKGRKGAAPQVLVGKGITFDTGGISLKPGPDMDQMKFDMCGAASVLATMQAVAESGLKINLVGVLACAENMPSGGATRPGDIVTTMSGQTVEILNTDAEGRLVLCDALTYVERYKPAAVIDIATLTGACIVALGKEVAGMLSNNDGLADQLRDASRRSQDKLWQLPLWDEYQKQLDSPFADMANIGGPAAGTITAACFLSRFARKYAWAHLDIAGIAWISAGPDKGATGRPVPLLFDYLLHCKA